ncbi:hypothetical protein [Actinocorallia longicatena]|uniref:hypothetical protein n=1 Tax=Actinocorallia longicatena TaxID=111803 RepID=UPI0031DAADE6
MGSVLAMALVGLHWYTGFGVDKTAKRLLEVGIAIFMVAIPVDVINHRVNGLDITSWSPSHALLYIGTALMLAGCCRTAAGHPVVQGVFFAFFLENWHFPAQHQEYGVLELRSWDAGRPYAEPSLLEFAAKQMGRPVDRVMVEEFSLPVSDWVYPLWTLAGGMLVLVVARRVIGRRWTATAIVTGYLAYRAAMWVFLDLAHFPASLLPVFLLAGAVTIDLCFHYLPNSPIAGALLVTMAGYAALFAQAFFASAPPYAYAALPVAGLLLSIGWYLTSRPLRLPPAAERIGRPLRR